ncbi:hypothetical protein FDUTEX481_02369 [Tolypothrix sp. PCC 7601]|nr:hypothetical protein FDUTEX481_02369 [Tolypothrix sp. PCC 7601]
MGNSGPPLGIRGNGNSGLGTGDLVFVISSLSPFLHPPHPPHSQ